MENILVAGVNTRSVSCSLKKLGYNVYSSDYFGVVDLQPCVNQYKSILSQKPYQSCGKFTQTFKSKDIEELAADFIDESDFIICLAGVSPENFPKNKLMGNKSVRDIDDKYQLYKKLKNKFKLPNTFRVSSISEADEIASNYPDKNFILKPTSGSGGYGVRELDKVEEGILNGQFEDFSNFILQEQINGVKISASVLSTGYESKTILISQQIIGDTSLGQKEPFGYCGSITPLTDYDEYIEISEVSEEIINHLSLIGSNGVDFIIKDDELFIIEVNPRIQGTMECAELALNINMAEAHIQACNGSVIDVPPPERFAVKMIVHAQERSRVRNINSPHVYDLPARNVIIEKGEPVATVIESGKILEDVLISTEGTVKKVYNKLKVFK